MIYCDTSVILDTTHLVEAHPLNGTAECDGMYIITVVLSVNHTFMERFVCYPTQEARDKAFVALGMAVKTSEKP